MPIDLELLQKIERQRQRLEDGVRPAKLIEGGLLVSPAKKEASFAATTPPSSQELSSSFVTPSSRSSGSTPELGSYRLTEGRCEALSIPWSLDLEDEAKTTDVEDDFPWHCLWHGEPCEASLAATAQICLGAAPERCPSRDLSPVDETKVMAWRPKSRRTKRSPKGVPTRAAATNPKTPRPAWSSASKPDPKKVSTACHSRGAAHPSPPAEKSSTELQLRRLSKELAAEGQRFRQQGKLCFELAVRAEALHSEVRVQQQQAAREREAKLIRAAGRLQKAKVISSGKEKDNS